MLKQFVKNAVVVKRRASISERSKSICFQLFLSSPRFLQLSFSFDYSWSDDHFLQLDHFPRGTYSPSVPTVKPPQDFSDL